MNHLVLAVFGAIELSTITTPQSGHILTRPRGFVFRLLLLMIILFAGCTPSHSIESREIDIDLTRDRKATPSFDAGIIFSDRPGYTCISLERVGIPSGTQIVRLKSSCECVKPRAIVYLSPDFSHAPGILLEYVPEDHGTDPNETASATDYAPMLLRVIVEAHLADNTTRAFSVDLLHTTLVDNTMNRVSP